MAVTVVVVSVSFLVFCRQEVSAQQDSTIIVGIYQNPPKVFIDENGKAAGIFVELLEEIARQESWQLEYFRCNWNDCLQSLEQGEIDLMPDVAFTFDRNKNFNFNTLTVLESWSQVYAAPGSQIRQFSDLEGKSVALVEGSVQQPLFRQVMKGFGYPFTEISSASFKDAFAEVKIGIADAAIANYFFGEMHFDVFDLEKTPVIFSPALLHFAAPKGKNVWLLETIDNYLVEWKNTPVSFYYTALKKYNGLTGQQTKQHSHRSFFLAGTGLILLFGLILMYCSLRFKKQRAQLLKKRRLLHEEKEKLRNYFENAPLGMMVADEHGHFVEVNQRACAITGFLAGEMLNKSIFDLIPEEAREEVARHFNKVVADGKTSGTYSFVTQTGEKRFWTIDAVKISDSRFIVFINDTTGIISTSLRLERLSKIFHQSVNEIYLFDASSLRFVEVNEAALANIRYSLKEMKQMTPLDLKLNMSEKDFKQIIEKLKSGQSQSVNFETQLFRKDGVFYEAEVHLQLLECDDERLFAAVVHDITERKKAEDELKKMKEKLESEVKKKTKELNERIEELESFREATIARELRMEELRKENEMLKKDKI